MNKIMLAVITLLSAQAFATKARIAALGSAVHLVDPQGVYSNPLRAIQFEDILILESGLTAATSSTNNAEGAIFYKLNTDATLVLSVGDDNDLVQSGRRFMNSIVGANTYSTPQNMVHVVYGQKEKTGGYSIGFMYSYFNDRLNARTESSVGMLLGYKSGAYSVFGSYDFVNSVDAAGNLNFEGGGAYRLSGRYSNNDVFWAVDTTGWIAKSKTAAVENESYYNKTLSFRVVNSLKKDGNEIFYGLGVMSNEVECKTKASASCTTKFKSLTLPIIVGAEYNAADWLTFRSSIIQSLPLDTVKDEIGLPAAANSGVAGATGAVTEFSGQANTTTAAFGAGIKFNKITVDGTISGLTAGGQTFGTAPLLSQVGLTYRY